MKKDCIEFQLKGGGISVFKYIKRGGYYLNYFFNLNYLIFKSFMPYDLTLLQQIHQTTAQNIYRAFGFRRSNRSAQLLKLFP